MAGLCERGYCSSLCLLMVHDDYVSGGVVYLSRVQDQPVRMASIRAEKGCLNERDLIKC
jgi:hypothetical protein